MKENKKKIENNTAVKYKASKSALIGALLVVVVAVIAFVHGTMYSQYFDIAVIATLLVGAVLWLIYAVTNNGFTAWFGLLGELSAAFGLGLFLTNSYNVWADTWGNISQNGVLFGSFNFFGSEGGPVLPAIIIVLGLVACVCGVIACFGKKEAK